MRIIIAFISSAVLICNVQNAKSSEDVSPVGIPPVAPAVAAPVSDEIWLGSDVSIDAIASIVTIVVAATAKEDAVVDKRDEAHISTSMDGGGGRVIRGGGYVTFAHCRQTFTIDKVMHGEFAEGDRLLDYGFVEKSDAFPGPRAGRVIPRGVKVILFLDAQIKILKALRATAENLEAVEKALPALGKKPTTER
jgi:hypothetical protein